MTGPTWPEHQPELSDGTIVLRPWASADADSFVGKLSKQAWASKHHVPFCISSSSAAISRGMQSAPERNEQT